MRPTQRTSKPAPKSDSAPLPVAKIGLAAAPVRSNAGGAVRGQARAAQVHALNAARTKQVGSRNVGKVAPHLAAPGPRRDNVVRNAEINSRSLVTMAAPQGARNKTSAAANSRKQNRVTMDRGRRERAAAGKTAPRSSAPSGSRSAGFNPFGVPASTLLDAIINSQKKRR